MSLGSMETLGSSGLAVGRLLGMLGLIVLVPMMSMIALVMLRRLTGRTWAAVAVVITVLVALMTLGSPHPALDLALGLASWGITLAVMIRIGLLAAVSLWTFEIVGGSILTFNPGAWEGPAALVNGAFLLALAGYAAWAALGGRVLLADDEPAAATSGASAR
jgi:hypothetical protein